MRYLIRFKKTILIIFTIGLILLFAGVVYSRDDHPGIKVNTLQFDVILELNAPDLGTHVVLFARYWVSPDFYIIAVVWAEPYISSLNFPTHPPTLMITSNKQTFALSNQIHTGINSSFSKPVGARDVFQNTFNSYTVANIRFAESEALSSRIYTNDLGKLSVQDNSDWKTIHLKKIANEKKIQREFTKLDIRVNKGRLDVLNLVNAYNQLIKGIQYEYNEQNDRHLLRRQNVLLPERHIVCGFRGKGATLTMNGKKQTFKELPAFHHTGGRKCTVDYKPIKTDKGLLPVPTGITVQRADTNDILRTAHISNFVTLKMSSEKVEEIARQFSQYDDKETQVREMVKKYWLKKPNEIEEADAEILEQLRSHFKNSADNCKIVGDKLKQLNMLMEIDWIQGNQELQKHFGQYLTTLTENNLNKMTLYAGLHVIDTTIRWDRFPLADKLLLQWIKHAIDVCNTEDILSFAQNQIKFRHYWTIAGLLEELLKSNKNLGLEQFDAQALKCIALSKLFTMIKEPEKIKTKRAMSQAGWASWSISNDNISITINDSLAKANRLFTKLDNPTKAQKVLKVKLSRMNQKIHQNTKSL